MSDWVEPGKEHCGLQLAGQGESMKINSGEVRWVTKRAEESASVPEVAMMRIVSGPQNEISAALNFPAVRYTFEPVQVVPSIRETGCGG